MVTTTGLTAPEVHILEQTAAYGPHYRMRRRSQAGHSRGQSISRRACFFAVDADIVSRWLRRWRAQGLREGTRYDRPPPLDAATQKN